MDKTLAQSISHSLLIHSDLKLPKSLWCKLRLKQNKKGGFFADFQTLRDTRIKVYSRFEKKKKASRDIKRAALAQEQGR